jgi:hypothetical protein
MCSRRCCTASALSRLLCRALVLPGFYVRFGSRLTRVSGFEERRLPTSHFLNLTTLRAAFHVVELQAWIQESSAATTPARGGRARRGGGVRVERLLTRSADGRPAQLRFFGQHGIAFDATEPANFPHFMQQQSEM